VKSENLTSLKLSNDVKMIFIKVPAGEFLMGSKEEDELYHMSPSDEIPQHLVYLEDYWIGQTPVTNSQFACFNNNQKISIAFSEDPVTHVNWYEALEFCDWMAKKTGYPIHLPSEAEWEKAARGTDGQIFPWGDEFPTAELTSNIINGHQVGCFPKGASPYGVLDMAGNVFEWVSDWYDDQYYHQSPYRNPQGPLDGTLKVCRGGDWWDDIWYLRAASRYDEEPNKSNYRTGFRCVF